MLSQNNDMKGHTFLLTHSCYETAVEGILRAAGIDINKIISDIVEAILEKIGIPDADDLLAVLPELDFLGEIDLGAELFDELKETVAPIFEEVTEDPLEEAFDSSGEVYVEFDGVPLEFRRAKGTPESIQLNCPSDGNELIPLTLVATVTNACGRQDLSGQIEVPCQKTSDGTCDVDLRPFLSSRCQKDAKRGFQGYGFRPGSLDESSILYVCIRPEDLGTIQAMPTPNQLKITGSTTRSQKDFVCAEGARVLPLGYTLQKRSSSSGCLSSDIVVGPDRLSQAFASDCSFDDSSCSSFRATREQCAMFDFHRKTRRLKVSRCKTDSRSDFYSVGAAQFLCLQPFRDFIEDPSTGLDVNFHMVTQPRTLKSYDTCTCRKVRNLDCTGAFQSTRILDYEIPQDLQELRMVCPSDAEIRVLEVLQLTIEGSTFSVTDQTNVTESYQELCDGKRICPKKERPTRGFQLYRSTHECVCSPGFVRDPGATAGCLPCDAGTFREDGMDTCEYCEAGTFSEEGSAECSPCEAGFFADLEGTAECAACPAGTFGTAEGSASIDDCTVCPANTFSGEGSSDCEECEPGHVADEGSEECIAAQPGQFVSSDGVLEDCPPGSFSAEEAATSCELCPEGSYSRIPGSVVCIDCPWGTFGDSKGSISCEICPENTYHTEIGATSEVTCVVVNEIDYTSPEFSALTCEQLLALASGTEEPDSLEILMNQVGNGICNRGPWNTPNCAYDGGDCCRETCQLLTQYTDSQYEPELGCTWSTYECIDPSESDEFTRVFDPRVVGRWWSDEEEVCPATEGQTTGVVGDGVCDPVLNTKEFGFDGGDCCVETCIPNPALPESCMFDCYCSTP